MNLQELTAALARSGWHRGPEDVEILVDNGNGDAYTLTEAFDQGNHIVLQGDKALDA